jgi:hypothetical protein
MTAKCCQAFPEITRGLKTLAQELDMPVLSLSQLSRAVEQRTDGQAQLSDNPAREGQRRREGLRGEAALSDMDEPSARAPYRRFESLPLRHYALCELSLRLWPGLKRPNNGGPFRESS